MAIVYPSGKSGNNILSEDLTAIKAHVLKGETFLGKDTNDEIGTGELQIYSVVDFKVASINSANVTLSWRNPSSGIYGGIIIRVKEGSYPTSVTDGSQAYKGTGTNKNLNGLSSCSWTAPNNNRTYYFSAWMYCDSSIGTFYSPTVARTTAFISLIKGSQTFTSSGIFTVPIAVNSLQVFMVGGGGAGGSSLLKEDYNGNTGYSTGGGGGGGGYTKTFTLSVSPGQKINVIIGAGGTYVAGEKGNTGGVTFFGGTSVSGGEGGGAGNAFAVRGGNGGSGGGSGDIRNGAQGGTDGGNGAAGEKVSGGQGQGSTTRAFGESNNTLFSGGGGAGGGRDGRRGGSGGDGGGGDGARGGYGYIGSADNGVANTGGGGGGGGGVDPADGTSGSYGANGGSGICIVRWGY